MSERLQIKRADKKEEEAKRKAGEQARILEQNIKDYSCQKNLPAIFGRDGDVVVIERDNRRLLIIVTEALSGGEWHYNLQPSEGGRDDTMLPNRNENQMIDAISEWFAGRSLAL